MHNNISLLQYEIYADSITNIDYRQNQLITTINQYSYCIAERDIHFKKALSQSDILLPDGSGIVFAAKFLKNKSIKKIAGADIHKYLLEKLNENYGSCMYLGSSEETLLKIRNKIAIEYPNISLSTHSPPYKSEFSKNDLNIMIESVNKVNPDVLFVGMTAPKQEKWAFNNKTLLKTKTICAIGAVFDFYAGTIERPRKFWIDLHLEWLIRLIKEPKRLWRRYLYFGPLFIFLLLKIKMQNNNKYFIK